MAKRLFDVFFSLFILIITLPLLLFVAIGIKIASPGAIFYVSERLGKSGKRFNLYKFRTMDKSSKKANHLITSNRDPRIFSFGALLRATKIDELPQFFNVLKGDMSIVGPRPEIPEIVDRYYDKNYRETLYVLPGLTSPGSLFNYTHGDYFIDPKDPEGSYAERLLPIKMALEIVYMNNKSFLYDIKLIIRTILVIFKKVFGDNNFVYPPEFCEALKILKSWGKSNI